MKKRFLVLTLFLSLLMVLSSVSSVFADADQRTAYGYTVKVYAGEQGTFTKDDLGELSKDGKILTIKVDPGKSVTINKETTGLKLNEGSEYYDRGFRIAGHDNDELVATIPAVNADASYEVAYGLKGNMVKYTIMYLNAKGEPIRGSDEYYGMVGDKPVISYKYIEGYQPNAYNLTKTLVSDESKNVFGFSYIANPEGAAADNGNAANGQAGAGNAANGQNANAGANANADAANANANDNAPAAIVDLDDNATPLADGSGADIADSDTPGAKINPVAIGGGALGLAAIAIAAIALLRRRNRYDEEEARA